MRPAFFAIAALGMLVSGPAAAQAYDPNYPVCLQLYGGRLTAEYIDCSYTSIPQCQATASGRPATCIVNPFYAGPKKPPKSRSYKRRQQAE